MVEPGVQQLWLVVDLKYLYFAPGDTSCCAPSWRPFRTPLRAILQKVRCIQATHKTFYAFGDDMSIVAWGGENVIIPHGVSLHTYRDRNRIGKKRAACGSTPVPACHKAPAHACYRVGWGSRGDIRVPRTWPSQQAIAWWGRLLQNPQPMPATGTIKPSPVSQLAEGHCNDHVSRIPGHWTRSLGPILAIAIFA